MRLAACLVVSLPLLAALPAAAQSIPGGGVGPSGYGQPNSSGRFTPAGVPEKNPMEDEDRPHASDDDKATPPPAIPGAIPGDNDAAPAEKSAAEMSPNDALFDSIARGDLGGAKDALNRGAQLDAHNILGQTPIDASIDLDRNDITFLLLSMRGAVSSGRPPPGANAQASAQAAAAAQAAFTSGRTGKVRHGRKGRAAEQEAPSPGGAAARTVTASSDRGQPNPAAGFIGF